MPKPDPNEPRVRYDPDYPLVGETLGLWRLLRGIGRGGMGEVYEAAYDYLHLLTLHYPPSERGVIRAELAQLPRVEQAKLASETLGTSLPPGARFAIKVCSARKGTAGHKRFLQEAELAERLGDHPYIVSVHAIHNGDGSGHIGGTPQPDLDTGRHRDVAYMVMDLAACDYQHTELARDDAVHVIRCIATALDHAHRRGVVHRDLKPENILGSVDHPLLTDFGIAKEIDQSLGLTRTGQVIGTLDYMSPEQATDAKSVDHRSDIYSLGVVLYEMATRGQLPYLHLAQREAALAAIRSERAEPRWPREHDAQFPRALEWIILKAMAHRREERYQQASELLADLDRYVAGQWLWPIGRVHPRRYLRYLWNRYPKIIRGGAIAVALLIILLVGLELKEAFDTRRQELTRDLIAFEAVVAEVEAGRAQQLDAEERERFWQRLQPRLEEFSDSYPELRSRFVAARNMLERHRWLALNFSEEVGRPIDPMEGRRQLNLAFAGCEQLRPTASGSMQVQERQTWRSRHAYGTGVTYVNLLADVTGRDFALRLLDSTTRHRTELTIRDGRLALVYQRDEEPEEVNEAGRIDTPFRLDCFLEVSDDADAGVRLFIAGMPRIFTLPRPGLRPDSPVIVELELPGGTELHYLEIRPQALPEE